MICSKCGNNCKDGDVLCSNCGYSLLQNDNQVNNNEINQNMNNNYNMQNNGQYQNMNYNYNMQNNGQYQNMNNNYPNRKVKSSAGAIVAVVIIVIIVAIVGGILLLIPLFKSLIKNTGLMGEWYCSENISYANQEEASAHITLDYGNTFVWAKNGDESNNYYSGDYKITDIEIKTGENNFSSYKIELNPDEGKIDGINNSSSFNSSPRGFTITVSRNKDDNKVHAVFASNTGSSTWYCVKKEN